MKIEIKIIRGKGKKAVKKTTSFNISDAGEEASNILVEKVRLENKLPVAQSANKILTSIMETQLKNLIRGSIDI